MVELMPTQVETIEQAINVYGEVNQKIVAIEELSELQKEICKDLRGQGNSYNLAEEIADVIICLEQLIKMYGYDKNMKIETFLDFKTTRLKEKLKEEE